jgi:hypothetical protein
VLNILNDLSFAYFKKQDYDQALICCDKIHEVTSTEDLKVLSEKYGVHFGEVRVMPDWDRHGTNINIPFRVEGLKGDDLVIVKDGISREEFTLIDRLFITEALYSSVLKKENFTIRYLGLFELRNITGMHKIYQVMTGNEK